MRKVKLTVHEKLRYTREMTFSLPDDMSEEELADILDDAQRGSMIMLDDFLHLLKKEGIELTNSYDDSLDSPDDSEIECDEYDFIDNEEAV